MVIMGLLSLPFLVVPFTVMGIIWGLYQSVNTYLYNLFDNVGVAQSGDGHNSEPAIRKYLFYKAYVDIKNILQESFIDFIGESTLFFRKITTNHAIYGWLTNLVFCSFKNDEWYHHITSWNRLVNVCNRCSFIHYHRVWLASLCILLCYTGNR